MAQVEVLRNPFVAMKTFATADETNPSAALDLSATTPGSSWANISTLLDLTTPVRIARSVGLATIPVAGQALRQNAATAPTGSVSLSFILNSSGRAALNAFVNEATNYAVTFAILDKQPSDTAAVAIAGVRYGFGILNGDVAEFVASADQIAVSGAVSIALNHYAILS